MPKKKIEVKTSSIEKATYENIYVDCPNCGKKLIYNRVTDLNHLIFKDSIAGDELLCYECQNIFWTNMDNIAEDYWKLFYESYEMAAAKQYRYAALCLCQSLEVFFYYAIKVRLLLEPLQKKIIKIGSFNKLIIQLHDKIQPYAFSKMRNLFLNIVRMEFANEMEISDAMTQIDAYVNKKSDITDIKSSGTLTIEQIALLENLLNPTINTLRNNAVHKFAYRPSRKEIYDEIEECKTLLHGLQRQFNIKHPIKYRYA